MASKFQEKTIKEYERKGYLVIKLIRASGNGYADLICFKDGEKPIFIECKEATDTVKPLQIFRGKQVEKYGCKFLLLQDGK